MFIPDRRSGFFPHPGSGSGSRGQKSPDPGSTTLVVSEYIGISPLAMLNQNCTRKKTIVIVKEFINTDRVDRQELSLYISRKLN
jgi:hypothetical protein